MREVTTAEEEAMEGITIEVLGVSRRKGKRKARATIAARALTNLAYMRMLAFNLLDHRPNGMPKLNAIQCATSGLQPTRGCC